MTFLTPLYILGVLAVVGPILFHLIRRTPKGEVPFSSLMFLAPSPPRLTRRSRLDHWLLLLLRATALCLLAFAFARPFLRQAAQLDFGDTERQRIAILIDTSASMRRGDLWARAKTLADQAIAECRPANQLAVLSFDATTKTLLGFDESMTLDPAKRQAIARARLDEIGPTWNSTHLGQALIDAVAAVEDVADASEKTGRMPRRVVLVSDLPEGSRLDALGNFEWPSDVELDLKTVTDKGSNASLHGLAAAPEAETAETARQVRVRVSNDEGTRDKFVLTWTAENGDAVGSPIDVYVPPGESRVVRVPRPSGPTAQTSRLTLSGDVHGFDNSLHFADMTRDEAAVLYVGTDGPEDPSGLLYYLGRVFADTPQRSVRIVTQAPTAALDLTSERSLPLVILAGETTPENVRKLRRFLEDGGTVLDVVTKPGRAESLAGLADVPAWDVEEAKVARDVLLGEIAFDHPFLAPLAGAQFNDFTKIHFWKYRRLNPQSLGDVRVLTKFENGDPALVEKTIGRGRLVILTSGWNPADSQLARSSKFVPLMTALLDSGSAIPLDATNIVVGDRVPLPTKDAAQALTVRKPDGTLVTQAPNSAYWTETDQPGVYTFRTPVGTRSFAVNLDPQESQVAPLHVETLEQLGCRLANPSRPRVDHERLRQLRNAELEGRQKLWRWLVLAAIGVLIVETVLAGRLNRPRLDRAEA